MFNLSSTITEIPDPVTNFRRPFLTPIPNSPGEFLLVLDNTSLDHIKRCHKNAENYLIRGREAHARNAALVFGGALHEGLEVFHTWQWEKENAEWTKALTPLGWEQIEADKKAAQDKAVMDYFLANPIPPDILSYDYRTPAAALEILRHYRRRCDPELHPDYEIEILSDESGPIIERSFELPMTVLAMNLPRKLVYPELYSDDVPTPVRIHLAWSGRIDLLALVNGLPRVLDHKTSSVDTPDYFRGFELSSQVRGYVWAARRLWPNLNIKSFCHNGIFFKRPNKSASPSASLISRGAKGGPPPLDFRRTYYPSNVSGEYSDSDLSRWLRDTILLIEDFLHSVSRSIFPMNDSNCVVKYGLCPYHDVCTMADEKVGLNYLMSAAYKTVTWNPTNP